MSGGVGLLLLCFDAVCVGWDVAICRGFLYTVLH
jgi:hypothetical protein